MPIRKWQCVRVREGGALSLSMKRVFLAIRTRTSRRSDGSCRQKSPATCFQKDRCQSGIWKETQRRLSLSQISSHTNEEERRELLATEEPRNTGSASLSPASPSRLCRTDRFPEGNSTHALRNLGQYLLNCHRFIFYQTVCKKGMLWLLPEQWKSKKVLLWKMHRHYKTHR